MSDMHASLPFDSNGLSDKQLHGRLMRIWAAVER
jgi:hypothetical protein